MNTTAEKVVSEAMDLPPVLRAFVAEKLIDSLDVPEMPALSAKWKKELRRRCLQVDRGAVKLRDAETVFSKFAPMELGSKIVKAGSYWIKSHRFDSQAETLSNLQYTSLTSIILELD